MTKSLKPQSVKVYNDESKQIFHSSAAKEIEIYSENSRLNVFFHSTEKTQSPRKRPPIQFLLPKSSLYTEIKRKSQIKRRRGKLKVCLQISIDVLCHRRFYIVTEMAIKQLITIQRLIDTLRACLLHSPQLSDKDLRTVPQA